MKTFTSIVITGALAASASAADSTLIDKEYRQVYAGVSPSYMSFAKDAVLHPFAGFYYSWNDLSYIHFEGDDYQFEFNKDRAPTKFLYSDINHDVEVSSFSIYWGRRYPVNSFSEFYLEIGLKYHKEKLSNVENIEYFYGFDTEYKDSLLSLVWGGHKQYGQFVFGGEILFHDTNPDYDFPLLISTNASWYPMNGLSLSVEPQLSPLGDIRKAGLSFSAAAHF